MSWRRDCFLERAAQTREGWAEAAARMRARDEDGLLDEPFLTDFDVSEWIWERVT